MTTNEARLKERVDKLAVRRCLDLAYVAGLEAENVGLRATVDALKRELAEIKAREGKP